jgi:hypothetical protein
MPATAADLSSKALETAITVPSGAVSRNLTYDCASTNSSNKPAIRVLPFCGSCPGGDVAAERSDGTLAAGPLVKPINPQKIDSSSAQQLAAGNQSRARVGGHFTGKSMEVHSDGAALHALVTSAPPAFDGNYMA